MTGPELRAARDIIGRQWGLNRPLTMTELGQSLRLSGRDIGATIRDWERRDGPTGPASVAVEAMMTGWRPRNKF